MGKPWVVQSAHLPFAVTWRGRSRTCESFGRRSKPLPQNHSVGLSTCKYIFSTSHVARKIDCSEQDSNYGPCDQQASSFPLRYSAPVLMKIEVCSCNQWKVSSKKCSCNVNILWAKEYVSLNRIVTVLLDESDKVCNHKRNVSKFGKI